ncbi:2-keto-4-pentenoate hydratase [Adhaeretor mobilis]|uniref:2-keto-4-pentenoate hydratase n=1 Tax=Adhaeretor mobilis TaxID=1930276 RepID=UPI0011A3507A|nr:hypothetical protein [Adhaeretor mobilis]
MTSIASSDAYVDAEEPIRDITELLPSDANLDAIVEHLLQARRNAGVTRGLALQLRDLSRERAYMIQMALLDKLLSDGEKLIGWKMGGTLTTTPEDTPDPIFGFVLASDEYRSGSTVPVSRLAMNTTHVEAEIGFWIGNDLPGPKVNRKELESAIAGVGGTSELISVRVRAADGSRKASTELAITDGVAHGGIILPQKWASLSQTNLLKESSRVKINNKEIAKGHAKDMMNGDPLAAVMALANSLPKYGRHLRKGQVVIIGSMLASPPAKAGDRAEILFSTFDPLNVSFIEHNASADLPERE